MHTINRYTFYVIKKGKVEFVKEYNVQYCSESTRNIYNTKHNIYKPNTCNGRRCYNKYEKICKNLLNNEFK